ncbi:hypothetical protein PIIN_10297 [Serendipita indica DSM 11827]|uniref:Uncharacterized protein n=1 Tax=Serendipita indica (strain DSM 11827) TaxID=1109443 RepID=G4TYA9_SERID|nr:hypothetical protein PIIN_10297 [Serendipita indica DSM 11827]
MKELNRRFGAK